MAKSKCNGCNKEFLDSELYCYTDDVSMVYNRNIYYCASCYEKKYRKTPYISNQTYKERVREDALYFWNKRK